MWASLKAPFNAEPRCPEVPKATRCAGSDGSGRISWYDAHEALDIDQLRWLGRASGSFADRHRPSSRVDRATPAELACPHRGRQTVHGSAPLRCCTGRTADRWARRATEGDAMNDNDSDFDLETRLAALEARAPALRRATRPARPRSAWQVRPVPWRWPRSSSLRWSPRPRRVQSSSRTWSRATRGSRTRDSRWPARTWNA